MQSRIDALAYPPTHTYRLDGLVPTGVMADRVNILLSLVPDFFKGKNFLDIGANKGYFSLRAARDCEHVVSLEPTPECCGLLGEILPQNAQLVRGTFKSFKPGRRKFDRIFLGNGHHYPFIESGGWEWVAKLGKMSTGTLVLEGARGMECRDMLRCIPENLRDKFNPESMDAAFDKYWDLVKMTPTTGYTPDRYMIHYERR